MNESPRVALISGGAGGIGRRIAERFSQEDIHVHVCDASAENIEAFLADNPGATATLADVSERMFQLFLDNARRFAAGEPLRNVVDKSRWF